MSTKRPTWLDRAIADASHNRFDSVVGDLKAARGYLVSALEDLEIGLRREGHPDPESLQRLHDVITAGLDHQPFSSTSTAGTAPDLRKLFTEAIAYACDVLKRDPNLPEVRLDVGVFAVARRDARPEGQLGRAVGLDRAARDAFRRWRDTMLALHASKGPGDVSSIPLGDIVHRFRVDCKAEPGSGCLTADAIAEMLVEELFHVGVTLEQDGQRVVLGLRWRTDRG